MISYKKMGRAGEEYYRSMVREKDRLKSNEPLGKWHGKGSVKLNLGDIVLDSDFKNLYRGYAPDGSMALIKGVNAEKRVCGYDFTYSPSKSVNIFYGLGDETVQKVVQKDLWESVKKGLDLLEQHGVSRSRFDLTQNKLDLVVAMIEDGTSRANDVQLHLHLLIINVGVRADGATRGLESQPLLQIRRTVDTVIMAEYAKRLELSLGVDIERKGTWFEIKGVPKHVINFFSKRDQQITARLAEMGVYTPKAVKKAVLETRPSKKDIARSLLLDTWRREGQELGFTAQDILRLCGHSIKRDEGSEIEALLKAANQRLSNLPGGAFSENRLIREIATEAIGRGFGADEVLRLSELYLKTKGVVYLGKPRGESLYRRADQVQVSVPSTFQDSRTMRAFEKSAQAGALIVSESKDEVSEAVIKTWQDKDGIRSPEQHLAIVNTDFEAQKLNEQFQKLRYDARYLSTTCIGIKNGLCFEGDRIFFSTYSYKYGIAGGDFGTVEEIDKINNRLIVLVNNDSMETIPIKLSASGEGYMTRYIHLGYAIKAHYATDTAAITAENIYAVSSGSLHKNLIAYIENNDNVTVFTTRDNAGDRLRDISLSKMHEKQRQAEEIGEEFMISYRT